MHGLARLLTIISALLICTGTVRATVSAAVTSPPLGNAIRRTYDAGGRLTQEVMGLNRDGTDGNPGDRRARILTYVGGRLKSDVTDDGANGARLTILYSYDEKGRLRLEDETWVDPGAVGYHYVRTTEWTDGLNGSSFDTTVEWNAGALQGQAEGATHGVFHELGVTDGAGRVIEQWVQDAGNNAAPLERMRAVHDALGRPLAQRAEGLAATTYQYDRGTLAARTFGEDVTTYHYDTAGRLAEERSPARGRVVHYQYHPLGNVSQQVMHAGNEVTTLDFDKAGNVVAKTLPGDGPPWRYAHTATGLLLRVAPPGVALDAENQTFRYDYFADGLLSDVIAPEGPRRHYTYDGRRRPFHLDLIGEGGGDRTETWTWQGNVETHEGLGGWNTMTRYDGRGRPSLIEHARVGGALESFTAVTSRALRYGPFDGPVAIREVLTDFAGGDGLSSLPRNSTYTYDAAGRVRTATEPEGVIGYEYDLFQGHRRVVSTLPGGQTQGQILDSMGRVHQITLDEQVALTLEWNASGTLASITGRGLAESRSYDPAAPHRLTGIDIRREGAPVAAAPLVHLTYLHNFAAAGQAAGQVEPWLTVHRSDDGAPDVVSRYFVDAQLRLVKSEEDAVTRTYSWHADGRRDLEEVSAPGVEHSIRHGLRSPSGSSKA
jgi:YD repeat-containing protein